MVSANRLGGLLIFSLSPYLSVNELSGELGRDWPAPVSVRTLVTLLGIPICLVAGLAFILPIIVSCVVPGVILAPGRRSGRVTPFADVRDERGKEAYQCSIICIWQSKVC